jgi:hypothetical protein
MFQATLNKKMEYSEFSFTDGYSYYIVMTLAVCFYGYIAPLATPWLIFFLFLQYWADKYNMLRRCSCPIDFSFEFNELILCMFEVSLLFFSVGHLIWDLSIHFDATIAFKLLNILTVLLALAYLLAAFLAPATLK